jgi:hypothetical protein
VANQLLLGRFPPPRRDDRGFGVGICVLEALNERSSLIAGELSCRMSLSEAHRAAGISEIAVTSLVEKTHQLLHLSRGGRWARLLTERHGCQSYRLGVRSPRSSTRRTEVKEFSLLNGLLVSPSSPSMAIPAMR